MNSRVHDRIQALCGATSLSGRTSLAAMCILSAIACSAAFKSPKLSASGLVSRRLAMAVQNDDSYSFSTDVRLKAEMPVLLG